MGSEDAKDPFKGVDWRAVGTEIQKDPSSKPVIKKRLPKKLRQIPDYYFLPRRSLSYNLGFFGACIAGGIGAGMLLERMEVLYGSLINRALDETEITVMFRPSRLAAPPSSLLSRLQKI
ncbi:hypothetical protein TIFTF001_013112 [Ficus carica]|uniref:Uncharacterized protein n=1 Tax=Ficus carica TaxID=3494 RepID=A0AA88A0A2_FICCA|nr:hypothetical protein TIFTF001_013112 [Ficus carica]